MRSRRSPNYVETAAFGCPASEASGASKPLPPYQCTTSTVYNL